jgi:hypothetical protein
MACPFFMPMERFEDGSWPHPARLPLGRGWSGYCTAPGHEGERPEAQDLQSCNLGYADSCLRMPATRAWDAVRFAVRANALRNYNGAKTDGIKTDDVEMRAGETLPPGVMELQYVCERQHRPVEYGTLQFDAGSLKCLRPHADARVQRMAECFVQAVFERRSEVKANEQLPGTA